MKVLKRFVDMTTATLITTEIVIDEDGDKLAIVTFENNGELTAKIVTDQKVDEVWQIMIA